jgi:hypothetical protein
VPRPPFDTETEEIAVVARRLGVLGTEQAMFAITRRDLERLFLVWGLDRVGEFAKKAEESGSIVGASLRAALADVWTSGDQTLSLGLTCPTVRPVAMWATIRL